MTSSLSPRVRGLLGLTDAGIIAALAAGRPELAVAAAPLLVFVGVGLTIAREPRLTADIDVDKSRLLEGDHARAIVTVRNEGRGTVEVGFAPGRTGRVTLEPAGFVIVRLEPAEHVEIPFVVRPARWGAHTVGPVVIQARDPLGFTIHHQRLGEPVALRVFPPEQRLRELIAPLRTQPFGGTHVARLLGEGIEFADIRPFGTRDRARRVNWRASARRGSLHVTERHPEHASDVVLLLDTFEEARTGAAGTLDDAVRAAASLARAHLARRDRVALVDFGGTLHWLEPAFGTSQLYRIIDALLASEIAFSYAWRAVESIPRRILPPASLILAITPLLDERSIRLVIDLRTRGYDVTAIEVSPLAHTPPGPSAADAVGHRLWALQREALRARLQGFGIGVASWEDAVGLGPALEGVNSFRRSLRHAARA